MKREMIRILIALVLVLSMAPVAYSDTVVYNGAAYGSFATVYATVTGGMPDPLTRNNQPAGEFNITWNGNQTWAYCADFYHTIANSQSATPVSIPDKGTNFILAAYLLDTWRSQADTPKESAALQAAVWKAIYGNRFTLLAATDDQVEAYYAMYTGNMNVPGSFTGANYTFLDLYQVGQFGNVVRQGLITGVPEPLTLILLGAGLIGLAGLRRKE
jgi:hypothetical protein